MTAYTAADSAEFATRRGQVISGDTIELTGTTYNGFNWNNKAFTSEVTIFGTDPNNKPSIDFTGTTYNLDDSTNITFRDVKLQKPYQSGDPTFHWLWRMDGSDNIKFDNCEILGGLDTANSYATGILLKGINLSNLTITNCHVHQGNTLGVFGGCVGLNLIDNEFYDSRGDGFTLDAITGATITGNHFHDYAVNASSSAHPDMVQFTRNSNRPFGSTNVLIENNIFDSATGRYGQLLFGGDGGNSVGGYGTAWRHTGWTIRNNTIYGDHLHYISIFALDDSLIERNSVYRVTNGYPFSAAARINIPTGSFNTFNDNICEVLNSGTSPTLSNNQIVGPSEYDTYFNKTYWVDNGDITNSLEIKTGTAIHTSNAGSYNQAREGDWGGNGIVPHYTYLGGFRGTGAPPTLPAGSVSAVISVG